MIISVRCMCPQFKFIFVYLYGKPLELVAHFTYLGSNIISTESNVEIVRTNSGVAFSNGLLLIDIPVLSDQQGLTFINSMQTLDAVEMTYQE